MAQMVMENRGTAQYGRQQFPKPPPRGVDMSFPGREMQNEQKKKFEDNPTWRECRTLRQAHLDYDTIGKNPHIRDQVSAKQKKHYKADGLTTELFHTLYEAPNGAPKWTLDKVHDRKGRIVPVYRVAQDGRSSGKRLLGPDRKPLIEVPVDERNDHSLPM